MINDLKTILANIIETTLYKTTKLNKNQKNDLKKIKEYLRSSENIIEDIRTLISTRNNESYFAYDKYITDFFIESPISTKLEVLNNQSEYEDIFKNEEIYINIWNSLNIKEKCDYLNNKKKFTDIDINIINNAVSSSGNFKENIILSEILNNEEIRKKIPAFSINLNYSYNILSLIHLNDYEMCHILTKSSYTKLLLKKCKTFDDFYSLYIGNKKIFNLLSNNSLTFNSKDSETIYNFILENPNFISKFNNKYQNLFGLPEIIKLNNLKNLDGDAKSTIASLLYKFNESNADTYFSEDNLRECAKHSITVYPFDNLSKELQTTIFNTYSLFNRFIDTIMIEAINNNFAEEDIVNILRNDTFIDEMSSYAIELLLNKLSFKASFNMLQRKNIFNKINNLNVKIDNKDTIFIKGFLDSPILVFKSEHNMIYEMLKTISNEETNYYITLPYIINNLSNYEVINLVTEKNLKLKDVLANEELKLKLKSTDIISLIDKSFQNNVDLTIFKDKDLCKKIFNLKDSDLDTLDIDEVNYLFETIRMKSILSKQESKITVSTYKAVISSYLLLGLDNTLKIVNNGNKDITLDEIKKLQNIVVNEKILIFKENNSSIFQNMAKKLSTNLHKIETCTDINEFATRIRKNTYIDNIIYLMLENNFDSYNNIIEKLYSYVKYYSYDEFASQKEIYDYTKEFTCSFLNKKFEYFNNEFEAVILKNFKVLENVIYNKRKEIGKNYLNNLKFKLFVRALTDPNKEQYKNYFKESYPLESIKEKYIKYLANNDVDFESILEHVLIPSANNRFDKFNCLNKLGILKPKNTDEYNQYLNDLKYITEINFKLDKYKEKYNTSELISIMNYICYGTKISFSISKKEQKEFNKLSLNIPNLNGEIYIDKSALKFIYKDNMDIYNIEEIIEYNNYLEILDNILKKTKNYINRNMDEEKIKNSFSHDYFKAINTDDYQFPITNKYYEPKKRVLSLQDIETIFNGYDLTNYEPLDETLEDFLFTKKNLIMVVDGYYNGIVDNLGIIISKWSKIKNYISTLNIDLENLTLIGIENILTLLNFEDNPLGKSLGKEAIKTIYEEAYYEVNDLNTRINMLVDLKYNSYKKITSSIPYLCYKDDTYKIEIMDSYNNDIFVSLNNSLYKVGAIGNDFLHYSILNKNGLQIGIYKDDILVSKILGVRNGNTIYLNSLEGESDSNYNELLRLFANELISITRDDREPIEFITIVNNDKYSSRNGLKIDTTMCSSINNPINKVYYDFEEFAEQPNLLNPNNIYTNYEDNISTLLASSNIVDKNNFKYYDADSKYYRRRNNVIKLSNNIGEEYLTKIDTILYLCKKEDDSINIDDITLSSMKTIYLGDDYCLLVTERNNILKFILPYDERAPKEVDLIIETIEKDQ